MRPLGNRHTNVHDPAPSRLSYRLMRFMLTPLLRRLVFYGVPGFVIAIAAGLYFADEEHRDNLRAFACANGPAFYGLPVNHDTLTLTKHDTPVQFPAKIETPEGQLTVFDPGFDVFWSAE